MIKHEKGRHHETTFSLFHYFSIHCRTAHINRNGSGLATISGSRQPWHWAGNPSAYHVVGHRKRGMEDTSARRRFVKPYRAQWQAVSHLL